MAVGLTPKHLGEIHGMASPVGKASLDPGSGHQQAAGEVVADALDHLVSLPSWECRVDQLHVSVVDDVLELVGQAEALSGGRLGGVNGHSPLACDQ